MGVGFWKGQGCAAELALDGALRPPFLHADTRPGSRNAWVDGIESPRPEVPGPGGARQGPAAAWQGQGCRAGSCRTQGLGQGPWMARLRQAFQIRGTGRSHWTSSGQGSGERHRVGFL